MPYRQQTLTERNASDAALRETVRSAQVTLNAHLKTPVLFSGAASAAVMSSTETGPIDLSSTGDGGTFIVNPDAGGNETVTLNCAAGDSVGDTTPSTDISGDTDVKFGISVDGDASEEVTLVAAGADTGAKIATEMQTKIRALGGNKATVTVAYATEYTITSPTLGTDSAVVIVDGATLNVADDLKIGVANGGTETAGTGDCGDVTAVTVDELVTLINGDVGDDIASNATGEVLTLTSITTGKDSTVVLTTGTLNVELGFTDNQQAHGAQTLGQSQDAANATYEVTATLVDASTISGRNLNITDKTVTGFSVECETTGATDKVDLQIVGAEA